MPLSIATKIRIVIPQYERHCFESLQFSSGFPRELNGIITPQEFYQSMANINQTARKTCGEILCGFFGYLCLLAGIILLSILAAPTIQDNAFIPVLVVGLVLSCIGTNTCVCGPCWVDNSRRYRVTNVLADESMKYSRKLRLPFTWRLEIYRIPSDVDGDPHKTIENLIIEIGPSTDSEMRNNTLNFNSAEPTAYIGQQYPILPPSYIGQQYPIFPFSHPSAIHSSYITSYP